MRDIENYEGLYGITSCGRVWSYRSNKFLKPFKDKSGFLRAYLYKDGKRKSVSIHHLVAAAYIPNPHHLQQVHHKDKNKTHNWIMNLEWCDAKYNICYSEGKKIKCLETGEVFNTITEATESIGKPWANIAAALSGRQTTSGDYHWEYVY